MANNQPEPMETIVEVPPAQLGFKEIQVGSRVLIRKEAWATNPDGSLAKITVEQGVPTLVQQKFVHENVIFLVCDSEGTDPCLRLVVDENSVLSGVHKLLTLANRPIITIPQMVVTPEIPQEIEEPIGPTVDEESRQNYLNACQEYVTARDAKLAAEKAYKEVDEKTRETILNYLLQYGVETEEGKKNNRLVSDGFDAQYTFTEGQTVVKYDEEKIIRWLLDNGYFQCLKSVLDKDKWEAFKKVGAVPADFVRGVETVEKLPDSRKLILQVV